MGYETNARYEHESNIEKGVKNPFLLAIILCLHNLNHILVFMQITLGF